MNDKEILDSLHLLIHSVRLIPNYKPTKFEIKVSKLIIEKYKDSCKECKEVLDNSKIPPKTFLNKLGDSLSRM